MGSFAGLALSLFWLFCEEALSTSSFRDVNQTSQLGLLNPSRMKTGKTGVPAISERARWSLSPTASSTFTTLKVQSGTTNATILAETLNSSPEATTRSSVSIPDSETWIATATDLVTGVTYETTMSTLTSWRNVTLSGAETTQTEPHAEDETSPPTSAITEKATPSRLSTKTTSPTEKETYPPFPGSLITVSKSKEPKTMALLTETSTSGDSGKGMDLTVPRVEISTTANRMAVTAMTTTKTTPRAGTSIAGSPSAEPGTTGVGSKTSNLDDSSEEISTGSLAETSTAQTSTITKRAADSEKATVTTTSLAKTSIVVSSSAEPGSAQVSGEGINTTGSLARTSTAASSVTVMRKTTTKTASQATTSVTDSSSTALRTMDVPSGISTSGDSSEGTIITASPTTTSTLDDASLLGTSLASQRPFSTLLPKISSSPTRQQTPTNEATSTAGAKLNTTGTRPGSQTPADLDRCLPGDDSGFLLLRLRVNSLLNLTDPVVGKWLLQQVLPHARPLRWCLSMALRTRRHVAVCKACVSM
ncbi:mucin-20 isoform X2 [Ornithorhynchus anatinus]|uniref:mucin-20 isoform X2 n=1 Tax=Ornithorhynchus anatinus TaxID=9258 RepID=UPI0010A7A4B3|nr:mucin-20 isoform X2 [Ornithorhynchus anatinus]